MRVWTVTHRYPPDLAGGVERRLHAMNRAARQRGHSVRVLATHAFGAVDDPVHEGIEVHRYPWQAEVDTNGRTAVGEFERILKDNGDRPDALWTPNAAAAVAAVRLWQRGVHVVFTPGLWEPLSRRWRLTAFAHDVRRVGLRTAWRLEQRRAVTAEAVRRATMSVVASRLERAWCLSGADPHFALTVLPRGIELERWELGRRTERPIRPGTLRVLIAARLDSGKNIAQVIRAVAAIARPTIRLTIHGRGPEKAHLEALIAELGAAPFVTLEEWASDMAHVYAAHDVFVLSSNFEAYAQTVFEALASGCVVLLRRSDPPRVIIGCEESVQECPAVIRYDTDRTSSLASHLIALAEAPGTLRELSELGRHWPGLRSWSDLIERYLPGTVPEVRP